MTGFAGRCRVIGLPLAAPRIRRHYRGLAEAGGRFQKEKHMCRLRRLLAFAAVSAFFSSGSLHALTWVEVARLTHAGGTAQTELGAFVAIDGDVAVVTDQLFPGVARVFVRSAGIWTEAAELRPSDTAGFEFSDGTVPVAIRGDTIAVGSPVNDTGAGRVYVFVRPSGGWSGTLNESAVLDASDLGLDFALGSSVAFAGDSIVSNSLVAFNIL